MDTTQLKITLSQPLHGYLTQRAQAFGLTRAAYIKHLILADARTMEYPTFQASPKIEQSYQEALQHRATAIPVTDMAAHLAAK